MANTILTPVIYTQETLAVLENMFVFTKNVSRKYDDKFAISGGKIGDTINIRRPARYTVSSGAALSTQDHTETSLPLVINSQKHIDTTFTTSDLTLKLDDFSDRIIKPSVAQLAAQVDQDGLLTAKNAVGNLVGTAGTSPASSTVYLSAGQKLDEMAAPRDGDRFAVINAAANATSIAAFTGYFNAQSSVASQYKDGVFVDATNTLGFKIAVSQNVQQHTTGPLGGSPAVNGAGQGLTAGWASTTSLVTNAWTAAAAQRLAAGDVITIANVFAVNPQTRQTTGALAQFVVTANASSDASGNLTAVVSPAIISAGPFQNVSVAPGAGALITVVGSAGLVYPRNMAYHKSAFALGCIDLEDVSQFGAWGARKTYKGLSLRVAKQYAISTDTVPCRTDILYGWCAPYPELACQITG